MKYIIEQKNTEQSTPKKANLMLWVNFFLSICSTVKQFSPYLQHFAKTKVFQIISELELDHLKQNQSLSQSTMTATITHYNNYHKYKH